MDNLIKIKKKLRQRQQYNQALRLRIKNMRQFPYQINPTTTSKNQTRRIMLASGLEMYVK